MTEFKLTQTIKAVEGYPEKRWALKTRCEGNMTWGTIFEFHTQDEAEHAMGQWRTIYAEDTE